MLLDLFRLTYKNGNKIDYWFLKRYLSGNMQYLINGLTHFKSFATTNTSRLGVQIVIQMSILFQPTLLLLP